MKYLIFTLLVMLHCLAQAEDVFVPLSDFDNDSQQLTKSRVLEFWGYHNYQGDDNYQNTLRLRYYNPLEAGSWVGRLRLDTAVVSNYNSISSANNNGQYSAGNTMITVWGQDRDFLKSIGALVGARVTFPFGNNGQWAVGPQLNWSLKPDVDNILHMTDFSPLIRYMYGFDTKNNSRAINPSQPPLQRSLQLYPTIGHQLSTNTMLRFWDENSIVYNTAGGGWFIPFDAMITHRLSEHWVVAVGGSKQLVQTYKQYDWSTYAKVSFNF